MSDEIRIRQNDLSEPIRAKAFNASGFVNLTLFTGGLTFKMVGPVSVQGAAVGDANGNLTYTFANGETATPGTYEATFRGVDGAGKAQTFPQGTNLRVIVVPAL